MVLWCIIFYIIKCFKGILYEMKRMGSELPGDGLAEHYARRGYIDLGNMRPWVERESRWAQVWAWVRGKQKSEIDVLLETVNGVDGYDQLTEKVAGQMTTTVAEIVGIDPGRITGQMLLTSGSYANEEALHAWREAREGRNKVLVSGEVHSQVLRSAGKLGMEVVTVPVQADGTIDPVAAEMALREHEEELALVVLVGGVTQTGAVDSLPAAIANSAVPLHVDAAWGGANIGLLPEEHPQKKALMTLLERADSFTMDPHKFVGSTNLATLNFLGKEEEEERAKYLAFTDATRTTGSIRPALRFLQEYEKYDREEWQAMTQRAAAQGQMLKGYLQKYGMEVVEGADTGLVSVVLGEAAEFVKKVLEFEKIHVANLVLGDQRGVRFTFGVGVKLDEREIVSIARAVKLGRELHADRAKVHQLDDELLSALPTGLLLSDLERGRVQKYRTQLVADPGGYARPSEFASFADEKEKR